MITSSIKKLDHDNLPLLLLHQTYFAIEYDCDMNDLNQLKSINLLKYVKSYLTLAFSLVFLIICYLRIPVLLLSFTIL